MEKELFIITGFIEILMVIFIQWQIYISSSIRTFEIASYILGAFLLITGCIHQEKNLIILGSLTIGVRGIFIPRYILRSIKKDIWRISENKPIFSIRSSIIISAFLVVFSYILTTIILKGITSTLEAIPITLFLQGAFLIISRTNAYLQLIGYLIMENAMFLFGYLFSELPLLIEAGILLDIAGIVIISGIILRLRNNEIEKEEELYG